MECTPDQFRSILQVAHTEGQDKEAQQNALDTLYNLLQTNPAQLLFFCGQIVLEKEVTDVDAFRAIVYINRILRTTRFKSFEHVKAIWFDIPEEARTQLKQALMKGIMFQDVRIINPSSSSLALIAQIEFPEQWPDFLETLLQVCSISTLGVIETLISAISTPNFIKPRYTQATNQTFQQIIQLASGILGQENSPVPYRIKSLELLTQAIIKKSFSINFRKNAEVVQKLLNDFIFPQFQIGDGDLRKTLYTFLKYLFQRLYDQLFPDLITRIAEIVTADLSESPPPIKVLAIQFLLKCTKFELDKKPEPQFTQMCCSAFCASLLAFLPAIDEVDADTDESDIENLLGFMTYKLLHRYAKANTEDEEGIQLVANFFTENCASEDFHVQCGAILALKTYCNVNPFVAQFLPQIIQLAQSPNLTTRYYAEFFISDYIKTAPLNEDPQAETSMIITIASQLIASPTQIDNNFGCKIFSNFIERYNDDLIDSPISDPECFKTILDTLITKLGQPNVLQTGIDHEIIRVLEKLFARTSIPTLETRLEFCGNVFEKLKELIGQINPEQENPDLRVLIQTFFAIYSSVIVRLGPLLEKEPGSQFIDAVLQYILEIISHSDEFPGILTALANTILTVPSKAQELAPALTEIIGTAQQSGQPALIKGSLFIIGDLFRSQSQIMIPYAPLFIEQLLTNIENDDMDDDCVYLSLLSLGDVINNCSDQVVLPFRDRILIVIRNISEYNYNIYNKQEVITMEAFMEGIILISGAIIKLFSTDEEFLSNKDNLDILFAFTKHINPEIFKHSRIDSSLLLFLQNALTNKSAARKYNTKLNHANITKYLQSFSKNSPYAVQAKKCLIELRKA